MTRSTPQVAHINLYLNGRVQVVCERLLTPREAGSLRARIRSIPEVDAAGLQSDRDVTRITVRPARGVRSSALLATLVDKLQPTFKINVVFYLAVFALPSAASGWINAYGFAFLAPITPEERNRLAESFLAKFLEHMSGPGVIAYQEDQFFILSVEGDVPDDFDEEGLTLQEAATQAEGVNIALVVGIASVIDRPTSIEGLARRMRRQVSVL